MRFRLKLPVALAAIVLTGQVAYAGLPSSRPSAVREAASLAAYTSGEIKNIDPDRGTITLKHGPIENLGMPEMTMIFRIAKPVRIESLNVGDKVRFKADRIQGLLVVTELVGVP